MQQQQVKQAKNAMPFIDKSDCSFQELGEKIAIAQQFLESGDRSALE